MWDVLKEISLGSDIIQENKLSIACNKFEEFKIKSRETIAQMKNRFTEVLIEIDMIDKNKYSQQEKNLKV